MIASRSGAMRLPRVIWRREATGSLNSLMGFLAANAYGDSRARRRRIEAAIQSLRHSPLRCPVENVKGGLEFRKLIVDNRFLVYYVYSPPRGAASDGTLSIRAVKHAATQNPFLGVREALAGDHPPGVLSTRDTTDPAIA
jgi:plasmid stabilization system protein ParE